MNYWFYQEEFRRFYETIMQRILETDDEIKINGNVFYEENANRYKKAALLCAKLFAKENVEFEEPSREKPFVFITVHAEDFTVSAENKADFIELINQADDMILSGEEKNRFDIVFSIDDIWKEEQI